MVALKHTIHSAPEKEVIFYDGSIMAHDGVIEIPDDRPERIRRAWILGYSLDPETGQHVRLEDLLTPQDDSAKSEGTDEPAPKKSSNRRRRTAS